MNPVSRKSVSIMISSCERGDLSELQRALEETELDIGSEPLDSKGQTALHIACANGHLHIAQYLVNEKECSVMVEDVYGHNPFVLSLINKHWKVAEFLLTVAPNSDDFKKYIGLLHYGESLVAKVANEALIKSCRNGYFHLVKFVIKCKKDYKYAYLKDMRTTARSNGQLHIVQLLFKYCEPARDMTLSELHVACIVGDVEKVTTALASHGATVLSKTDWYRMSPLHYASCEPKILSMTMSIITDEKKALVNSKDTFGNTPLHYAVLAGCTESVSILLRAPGCDINLVNTNGEAPLHLACKQSDIMILKMLATEEICDLNVRNNYGDTGLHIAVKERMPVKYIKELTCNKTCSQNIANRDDMTPLQLALSTHQLSAMKLLLQCTCAKCSHEDIAKVIQDLLLRTMHADKIVLFMMLIKMKEFNINGISRDGQTFLHVTYTLKNIKYIQTLIQKPTCDLNIQDYSGDTALHIAVYSRLNSAEKIQCILECDRCDPNITNKRGYTPLHVASLNSQFDSVRILLNNTKCNPNLQNFQSNTALHLIMHQKSATDVEPFLMCDKVDVNIQNEEGNTPLHVAVIADTVLYVIEKLIGHPNCNPSITNHEGMTPLQLAFKTDQLSATEVLLISAKISHEDIANAMQDNPCLLHRVIHTDRMSSFRTLMKTNECNINEVNHDGQTPLHVACTANNMKYIQALIQYPTCDLNTQDDNGDTALHVAIYSKVYSAEKIQCILKCDKCEPNITNKQGYTPLHTASVNIQFNSVKMLLKSTKCNPNIQDLQGNTALHLSMHKKSATGIEHFLMCDKFDVNIQNEEGNIPLHVAVITGTVLYVIEKLIGHPNCNPSITNHEGMTPLQLAIKTDQLSATEVLLLSAKISHKDIAKAMQGSPCLLHRVIHTDRMSSFRTLMKTNECNINEVNHDGQTPLHVACTANNMKYIQALIQYPTCDLNIQDDNGDTALHVAIYSKLYSAEKIQCILKCDKCEPNITNKQGYTPLHTASVNIQFNSVKMLLKSTKCNPNIQDLQGNTALHLSMHKKSATGIEHFLMCDKVDVNIQNEEGNIPLHVAVITGTVLYVIEKLIGHPNCNLSITNHEGMTPLQLAIKTDQLSATEVLLLSAKISHKDIAKAMQGSPCLLHRVIHADMMSLFMILMKINEHNINEVNHDGQTPLHVACTAKNVEYIQALIQYPICDLNIQDDNGDTALPVAIYSKLYSAEKIQCILKCDKCDPNIANKQGYTPLHTASVNNQFNSVKMLLKSTKCNPNIQDTQGNTALHLSIHKKSVTGIEVFLMCDKVDVNIQNREGDTPLHVAVIQGAPPHVIRSLTHCEHCNICIVNNKGMTPLHISLNTREIAIANIIVKKSSCEDRKKMAIEVTSDVLYKAVLENYPTLVQALLDFQSEKVHLNLGFNETALHVACKKGYCDMIEILLEKGADVQAVDNDKYTPIHIVCRSLRLDCLKVLLGNKKCDINQQIANGDTALHIVCKMVNTDAIYLSMIQILLENGADVQAVDSNGDAPIHIVCKGLRLDCLKALLQSKGCDANQQNADGDTALHIVCKMVNIDPMHICKIEILLEKGANVQVVNKIGDAPIHIACNGLRLHCLKALLQSHGCDPNQQNADGDTALHIVCKMGENLDSNMRFIEALISTPGIDPEIANHAGFTPIEVAGTKYFVIQTVTNFLKHKQSSIQTYLKIFVVGNSGTGKSTLIKAVTTEASQLRKYAIFPKMKFVNPSDVPPYTAGIVPISLNSKYFGHAVLYDFAGQHEYYSSHAAVMENLILPSPPLFLLLIDISKPIKEIKEELVYWWQIINNHSQRAAAPPHVMFVGSHKDIVRARGEDPQSIIDEIMENSVKDIQVSFTFEGSFLLDCRKLVSQGLTALLTKLNTTCQVFRKNADVNLHCHILNAFLTTTELKELVYCQIFKILEKINSDDAFLPQSSFQLIPLLSTLSDQGHILVLQNHTDLNKSWVILKPEVLLAKVNGSIFAPDYFKEHLHNFAMSTGVVTFTKIREKFTEFNHEVIVEFLIHLEFCFRIKDEHTLKMIAEVSLTNQASEYREEYYFFPALVRNENPENVCQPLETDIYQYGWFYKCGNDTEQLTTRFLHVLILRVAFSCEPPDDPTERESVVLLRSCSVWKHGIAWWTNDGIETIVEVGLQCRWVAVMMRCPDTHKVQCAELRSKVIAIVLKAKQDFCQATKMNEFLIAPSCLHYPFEGKDLTLYSMKKIASVIVEGKDFVKDVAGKNPLDISQLLPFEPYNKLEDLISRFFTAEQSLNEEISQECLEEIAMKCHKNLRDFETALQPNLIAYEEECSRVGGSEVMKCVALFRTLKNSQKRAMKTWIDFEYVFRRFSIFCGRNPKVILFV